MIKYAREDVHYLLYIYDRMRQDLISLSTLQNLEPSQFLKSVLKRSSDICLQLYSKPKLKDESYYNLVLRNKIVLSPSKVKLLKNLLKWRFKYAAIEDEHPNSILSNSMVFQLIDKPTKSSKELPRKLSSFAKKYEKELIDILNEKSNEDLPEFVTIQRTEKNIEVPVIESEGLNKTLSVFVPFGDKNSEKEFKIVKTAIVIPKYKGKFIYENEGKNEKAKKIEEIKKSFNYENYIEYIFDVHPEIKPLFKEAQQFQQENSNKTYGILLENNENNDKNEKIEENEKKAFDFIGFTKEKGEVQVIKKKEFTLNLDQEKIMNELKEIPKSIKEKYGTEINDKKSKNKRKFNEIRETEMKGEKKVKTEEMKNGCFMNKFELLGFNEEGEVEKVEEKQKIEKKQKKIETEQDFNEISEKIMSIFMKILLFFKNFF